VSNYAQWRSRADLERIQENPNAKTHMKQAAKLAERFDPMLYTVAQVGNRANVQSGCRYRSAWKRSFKPPWERKSASRTSLKDEESRAYGWFEDETIPLLRSFVIPRGRSIRCGSVKPFTEGFLLGILLTETHFGFSCLAHTISNNLGFLEHFLKGVRRTLSLNGASVCQLRIFVPQAREPHPNEKEEGRRLPSSSDIALFPHRHGTSFRDHLHARDIHLHHPFAH
jgi:hypothetical protein